jgi:hypothetical protein
LPDDEEEVPELLADDELLESCELELSLLSVVDEDVPLSSLLVDDESPELSEVLVEPEEPSEPLVFVVEEESFCESVLAWGFSLELFSVVVAVSSLREVKVVVEPMPWPAVAKLMTSAVMARAAKAARQAMMIARLCCVRL